MARSTRSADGSHRSSGSPLIAAIAAASGRLAAMASGRARRHRPARSRRQRRPARGSLARAAGGARVAAPLRLNLLPSTRSAVAGRPGGVRVGRRRPGADRAGHAAPRGPFPPPAGDRAARPGRRAARQLRAVGAKIAGVGGLFGPKVVAKGLATIALASASSRAGRSAIPAQLGGALVIAPGGDVLFAQLARTPATTRRRRRCWPRSAAGRLTRCAIMARCRSRCLSLLAPFAGTVVSLSARRRRAGQRRRDRWSCSRR